MRLWLASARPGDPAALGAHMARGSRVAVISNAQDSAGRRARAAEQATDRELLSAAGLEPVELDLRRCVGRRRTVDAALDEVDALWVGGGNVFVLRAAMARSGLDVALRARSAAGTGPDYGGFSAGACVAGATLRGLELVDPPPRGCTPLWAGIGLVDYAIVPHRGSPPPLGAEIDAVIAAWERAGTPYRALRDGEQILA